MKSDEEMKDERGRSEEETAKGRILMTNEDGVKIG